MNKIAAFIVNYNMPERTNALAEHIGHYAKWPCDLYVIDNGSDLTKPSLFTNIWIDKNKQTTGGWLTGLRIAKDAAQYFAYWFLITSAEFVDISDPLTPLAQLLIDDENAVGVHPALTADSTTAWGHMKTRGKNKPRPTWMLDNIASLYRAEWFDAMGGFDPELIYGWGIDLETCYKAREQGRGLWIHEGTQIKKVTDIGYTMERMKMSAQERAKCAGDNMTVVLSAKYGKDWDWHMRKEYVTNEMV